MYYLKSLFFNFLTVFFANHVLPGIEVVNQTKLPHVGGDLMFAFGLGLVNSLIDPMLSLFRRASIGSIALLAILMNFVAYALLKLMPIGIHISSIAGYLLAASVVALGSFLTNLLEMRHRTRGGGNDSGHTDSAGGEPDIRH